MENNRVAQLEKIQKDCRILFEKKNKDYGDAFASHGTIGVLVRISDKLNRFTNISSNEIKINVTNETLRDTLMDLHNYAAMAIMCMDNNQIINNICVPESVDTESKVVYLHEKK